MGGKRGYWEGGREAIRIERRHVKGCDINLGGSGTTGKGFCLQESWVVVCVVLPFGLLLRLNGCWLWVPFLWLLCGEPLGRG